MTRFTLYFAVLVMWSTPAWSSSVKAVATAGAICGIPDSQIVTDPVSASASASSMSFCFPGTASGAAAAASITSSQEFLPTSGKFAGQEGFSDFDLRAFATSSSQLPIGGGASAEASVTQFFKISTLTTNYPGSSVSFDLVLSLSGELCGSGTSAFVGAVVTNHSLFKTFSGSGACAPAGGLLDLGTTTVPVTPLGGAHAQLSTAEIDEAISLGVLAENNGTAGFSHTLTQTIYVPKGWTVDFGSGVSAVQEPSSLLLFGTGLLGFIATGLRKKLLA